MRLTRIEKRLAYSIALLMIAKFVLSWGWHGTALVVAADTGGVVKCSVETDKSILAAGEPQKVIAKVTLTAAKPPATSDRTPVNLCIVLDRSGSMVGDKIAKAKEAAIEAVKRLNPQDVFSLVAYDHTIQTIIPAAHVKDIDAISSKIMSIQPGGNTALFGGVAHGAAEIKKHIEDKYVHRIILLSDGLANVGPSTPEELGRAGALLVKQGISVTTVGVGMDYNEDLMTKLAQQSDGNSYFVESSTDLSRIFAAELGDVLNVTAKKVLLLVECPAGVTPVSIIGREGRINGQKAELTLNQLYGGQEKFALLELDVAGKPHNDALEVALANVRFEDPLAGRSKTVKGAAAVKFSRDKIDAERSVNASVTTAYEMMLSALTQEKAILLADKGKTTEAIEVLRKSASRLRSVGEQYGDKDVLKRAGELAAGAQGIETRGYGQYVRKALRTDSSQAQLQQVYRQRALMVDPDLTRLRWQPQRTPLSSMPVEAPQIRQQPQAIPSVRPEETLRLIERR